MRVRARCSNMHSLRPLELGVAVAASKRDIDSKLCEEVYYRLPLGITWT